MKRASSRQYTIRNVPDSVDRVLRQRARESGKPFNRVAVEALIAATGGEVAKRNLGGIAGSMSESEADALEREIAQQRRIDADLWS